MKIIVAIAIAVSACMLSAGNGLAAFKTAGVMFADPKIRVIPLPAAPWAKPKRHVIRGGLDVRSRRMKFAKSRQARRRP